MKKLIVLASAAFLGTMAFADAMYWQVSSLETGGTNVNPDNWSYAQVHVTGTGVDTYLSVWDGTGWNLDFVDKESGGGWFSLDGYNSNEYSFMLELVNDNWEVVGHAQYPSSYNDLVSQGVVVSSFDSIAPITYSSWNAGYVEIPEPSGGLLLMLGASLLALRRKRA